MQVDKTHSVGRKEYDELVHQVFRVLEMFRQLSRQCVARSSLTKGLQSLSTDLPETFMKSPESYYAYSYPETSNTQFSSSPSNTPEYFFAFLLPKQEDFGSAYRSPQPPPPENVGKVIVPSRTGQMEIYPGQPITLEVLKPGVVSLVDGKSTTRYFVTGGFAFIHGHCVDVATDEAIPLDHIDPAEVHKGLKESTQKLRSASTDLEKAEDQIGVDVHHALNAALQELIQEQGRSTSVVVHK
ncbi:ATP synthase subunit delta', mitochondrial-like [Papaver somniferum]|uniref:ATP synthase subunit delta', mitochondrial-like n=1 Tax=Papaver somniferum TaxID=3469 RepID=UPI000E6FDC42|nr:ATP synthase subunit delta', mitochondrial-like [Papaver somniferum]